MSVLLMQQLHAMVKAKETEIERLTAELAEAKAKHYEECAAIADEDDPEMTMTIGDRIRAALTDTKE